MCCYISLPFNYSVTHSLNPDNPPQDVMGMVLDGVTEVVCGRI